MSTKRRGLANDVGMQQSKYSTIPPLETIAALRNFINNAQRRLTRAFVGDENIKLPQIPDAWQQFVQNRETEVHFTTPAGLSTRQTYVKEDEEEIQHSNRPLTEGATPSLVDVWTPSCYYLPLDEVDPHHERDPIRRIVEETKSQHVKWRLCEILTRLGNIKQTNSRAQPKQVSILEDRLAALEIST